MTIEDRVAKLERECAVWRRLAVGSVLVAVLFVSCTQNSPAPSLTPTASASPPDGKANQKSETAQEVKTLEKVRTRELEIVNKSGVVVANFVGIEDGAMLSLRSKDFKRSIDLQTWTPDSSELSIKDREGIVEVSTNQIEVTPWSDKKEELLGENVRRLTNAKTKNEFIEINKAMAELQTPAVRIGMGETNGGFLEVLNPFGKVAATIQSTKKNEGGVFVMDVDGKFSNSLSTR